MKTLRMTEAEYRRAEGEFQGWCTVCRHAQAGIEEDAERVRCESCGALAVAGVGTLLETGRIEIVERRRGDGGGRRGDLKGGGDES